MPDEIRVGTICVCERTYLGRPDRRWEERVVRLTPKRAYLCVDEWFALVDPRRTVLPRS